MNVAKVLYGAEPNNSVLGVPRTPAGLRDPGFGRFWGFLGPGTPFWAFLGLRSPPDPVLGHFGPFWVILGLLLFRDRSICSNCREV